MAARKVKINTKTLYNIVEEVRKRPCLWDPDNKHHNNRGRVAIAWEEITEVLNLPEAFLRAKWKNMRDLFKRELKKCNVDSLEKYEGKWRHFKVLWFLYRQSEEDTIEPSAIDESNTDLQIKQEPDTGAYDTSDVGVFDVEPGDNCDSESELDHDPVPAKRQRITEEDYDMMFLKSLAPFFREIHPVRKLTIRNKIQDIILNEIHANAKHNKF